MDGRGGGGRKADGGRRREGEREREREREGSGRDRKEGGSYGKSIIYIIDIFL